MNTFLSWVIWYGILRFLLWFFNFINYTLWEENVSRVFLILKLFFNPFRTIIVEAQQTVSISVSFSLSLSLHQTNKWPSQVIQKKLMGEKMVLFLKVKQNGPQKGTFWIDSQNGLILSPIFSLPSQTFLWMILSVCVKTRTPKKVRM